MKKKILFLGYRKNKTKIISFLRKKNFIVIEHGQKNLFIRDTNGIEHIVSFGYRKIIKKKVLKHFKNPAINLHISYLPYNRGSHPNFWSFVENTPSGISIHEIDSGVDTGGIIYRKKIKFQLSKHLTFNKTYTILFVEIEKLFFKKYRNLFNRKYKTKFPKEIGTSHSKKDLPKNLVKWNVRIKDYLKSLK